MTTFFTSDKGASDSEEMIMLLCNLRSSSVEQPSSMESFFPRGM